MSDRLIVREGCNPSMEFTCLINNKPVNFTAIGMTDVILNVKPKGNSVIPFSINDVSPQLTVLDAIGGKVEFNYSTVFFSVSIEQYTLWILVESNTTNSFPISDEIEITVHPKNG